MNLEGYEVNEDVIKQDKGKRQTLRLIFNIVLF